MSTDTKLLAAENAELKEEIIRTIDAKTHWLRKLAAAQARIKALREALEYGRQNGFLNYQIVDSITTPDDTAELDALIASAERWNTVETLWYLSGDPLELGTTDNGGARVVFDGAESAGAVWEGNDLSSAIDAATAATAATAAMKEATP